MKYFSNKKILITGAASGLGKELALLLASYSAKLVLIDINQEQLEHVKLTCEKNATEVQTFVVNLLDEAPLLEIRDNINLPDIIFTNAGVGGVNPGFSFDNEIDSKIMGINYLIVLLLYLSLFFF